MLSNGCTIRLSGDFCDIYLPVYPDYEKDTPRKINNIKELRDNFYICYAMPDITQFKNTQWGVINAVSDMAGHMAPNRVTSNYQENNWGRIMVGHPFLDAIVKKFNAMNVAA